jgi:hypothetical protein
VELNPVIEKYMAEQATGCRGAGDYRAWAEQQGYTHLEVVDWTSSAGDWSFIVSQDGQLWFRMFQENNYPRGPGFSRQIDESQGFEGTKEEALEWASN